MKSHQDIDRRSLVLARAVVERIERDPARRGLQIARSNCNRWLSKRNDQAIRQWHEILQKPWSEIRLILLDDSERGRQLRQSTPFCGILSPQERWAIYRDFMENDTTGP